MAAPQALIKDLEGEVSVTRNGEVVAVQAGDFLLPGDEVVTGGNGRLSLEFPGTEGQIPAAGVMTANGKLTLGEQPGPNGQQIVVLEDGECFEFTTELAENSAAAEGGAPVVDVRAKAQPDRSLIRRRCARPPDRRGSHTCQCCCQSPASSWRAWPPAGP